MPTSGKTNLVVINENIAAVKAITDVCYTPENPPPSAPVVFGSEAYDPAIVSHTAPNADLTAGKVTLFLNGTAVPGGNQTYTDAVFASPEDGDEFRVANISATNLPTNTITFNDGTNDIAILAPGEFVRLHWCLGQAQWLKVPGV